MFIHDDYEPYVWENDIVLFKLSVLKKNFIICLFCFIYLIFFNLNKTPVLYSDYIVPICIPNESASFVGKNA